MQNAPEFARANGFYVATTTRHLGRTVYLKVTEELVQAFPSGVVPQTLKEELDKIQDSIYRLLVPTAKGYCVQTLIGTP